MDDVLSFLLVAVIYLFAAFSKSVKKKEKRSRRQGRSQARSRAWDQRRKAESADVNQGTQTGFADARETHQVAPETPEHDCNAVRQMHLHETAQSGFDNAAEGEDPCHVGQSELSPERESFDMPQTGNNEQLAQDVLRGVIMSEILTRPHERAAMRRGGR